jgi:hypothetical protein
MEMMGDGGGDGDGLETGDWSRVGGKTLSRAALRSVYPVY